jgi:hypothetical protein
MNICEKAIVTGKGRSKTFNINYMRDLGNINRFPPGNTFSLISNELTVLPHDMKFHDIMNIASGRFNRHSIMNCVRNKGISKQEFLNAQKVYDRLKK